MLWRLHRFQSEHLRTVLVYRLGSSSHCDSYHRGPVKHSFTLVNLLISRYGDGGNHCKIKCRTKPRPLSLLLFRYCIVNISQSMIYASHHASLWLAVTLSVVTRSRHASLWLATSLYTRLCYLDYFFTSLLKLYYVTHLYDWLWHCRLWQSYVTRLYSCLLVAIYDYITLINCIAQNT